MKLLRKTRESQQIAVSRNTANPSYSRHICFSTLATDCHEACRHGVQDPTAPARLALVLRDEWAPSCVASHPTAFAAIWRAL